MRKLTEKEIEQLEQQGCTAENWLNIEVDEDDFRVNAVQDVHFYGTVAIGSMAATVTVEEGFQRPSSLRHCNLSNVSIGAGCLIENVGGYIANYDLGNDVYISNVGVMTAAQGTNFGNGTLISVLNEGGDGNVFIYTGLTAQIAHLMMMDSSVIEMAKREVAANGQPERGQVGDGSRIVGVGEMTNVMVGNACEIQGARRLSDSTILSSEDAPTFIGADVILENTVVAKSATVADGAKLYNSFVGESLHMGRGFTSESSLFFANSHMENGEACAAFCGPFSCSHHKSTLLIGGQFSFYNAASGTNQSNHAYKMGPIHYGVLERGVKTASGSHILWPAQIGSFTMVMGKLTQHPNLLHLPFSYVLASEGCTWVVPGINLRTVGTWRDVKKWVKRDKRPRGARRDIINFAFPNPFILQEVVEGKRLLEQLLAANPTAEVLDYQRCSIRRTAAVKGIQYYDLAIRLFVYEMMNTNQSAGHEVGSDRWLDLAGMLAPAREIERVLSEVKNGGLATTNDLLQVLQQIHDDYASNAADYLQHLLQQLGGSMFIDLDHWLAEAEQAHNVWLKMVRDDAEHEYHLGDVSEEQLHDFLDSVK